MGGRSGMTCSTPMPLREWRRFSHSEPTSMDRNWEKGIKWSRVFGALLRHAWAMWRGEDRDPETSLPHIDHCAVNVMFLARYFRTHRIGWDDRPTNGQMNQQEQVLKALGGKGGIGIGGGSVGSVAD